jgi:ribosomal protein S18 acetylase RimI-like enzyme
LNVLASCRLALACRVNRLSKLAVQMTLELRQAVPTDSEWLFHTYKQTMSEFVTLTYGWDETLQQAGFSKSLRQGSCQIVMLEEAQCGFVHWEVEPDLVWLRMLCIVPGKQRKSIGKETLAQVMAISRRLHKPLYLHVFVCNRIACEWYERLGFVEVESDGKITTLMLA